MGKPVIEIGSITYAMKGQNILARHGIHSSVERIYRSQNINGCGYGIYVSDDAKTAEHILRQAGIPVLGYANGGLKHDLP